MKTDELLRVSASANIQVILDIVHTFYVCSHIHTTIPRDSTLQSSRTLRKSEPRVRTLIVLLAATVPCF
uniref:Ovule protein n=1 Tax=Ascaris lumbricoides TaxID=6252 RepID=A0A0M3IG20_ASCLU